METNPLADRLHIEPRGTRFFWYCSANNGVVVGEGVLASRSSCLRAVRRRYPENAEALIAGLRERERADKQTGTA